MTCLTDADASRLRLVACGSDLQLPGHAGGRESQPGQQDRDRSELRGPSPQRAQGKQDRPSLLGEEE